jgi:hypothetical protein
LLLGGPFATLSHHGEGSRASPPRSALGRPRLLS